MTNQYKNLDKYFNKVKITYNASIDKNGFEEICSNFGLKKIDKNTYQMIKTELQIVSSDNRIYTIPNNNQYFDEKIYEYIMGMYLFYYSLTEDKFMPSIDYVHIFSLQGLIMFLDFMTYYEHMSNYNDAKNKNKEFNHFQKMINKYKSFSFKEGF